MGRVDDRKRLATLDRKYFPIYFIDKLTICRVHLKATDSKRNPGAIRSKISVVGWGALMSLS